MALDMKELIAEAAKKLVMEKKSKKLTVKDIVEECHISRQAFYYHFADIPELIEWMINKEAKYAAEEMKSQTDGEQALRQFFLIAIRSKPSIQRGMQSIYRDELEKILKQAFFRLFEQAVETNHLYPGYTHLEIKIILRYHTQAVMGLLWEWTDADSKNIDQIVHIVYLMMLGKISPLDTFDKKVEV